SGECALQPQRPLTLAGEQTGNGPHVAIPGGRRHGQSAVHIDRLPVTGCVGGLGDRYGRGVPPVPRVLTHSVRLHPVRHCAGASEPHPVQLRYPLTPGATVRWFDVAEFHPDLPESLVTSGFAPCRAVGAVDEVRYGLPEVPQRLLLHRSRTGPPTARLRRTGSIPPRRERRGFRRLEFR